MFRTTVLFALLIIVQSSTQSFLNSNSDELLELALKKNLNIIDDLLDQMSDEELDNEISQLNQFNPGLARFDLEQSGVKAVVSREPDYDWDAKQMIEFKGFKFESHDVVTEDCYILSMHRIVNPLNTTANKPPVLLQHGLIDSSTGWLFNTIGGNVHDDDDRNLGFALAKRGYDVWLGNYRGNTYSKNHTTFSSRDPNFWKFTFDNHALQDLPAQIAYIQKETNYDQIAYIGYSQGTLTMFQLLSLKPEVAKAIKPYIALAPVAHLGNIASPIRFLANSRVIMRTLLYRNAQFLPNSQFSRIFSTIACRAFPGLICKNFLYLTCGFSDRQLNSTRMPVYFNHLPAGTSLANVVHFGLNYKSKKAQMLDYMTPTQNMECYNRSTPPEFSLEKITHKDMYLISASNDLLASPKDVELLKKELKVKFTEKIVELKEFGHVDFILSTKADYYVNDYIINVFKNKKPEQTVDPSARLRLKKYTANTCTVRSRNTRCHLDLARSLKKIV